MTLPTRHTLLAALRRAAPTLAVALGLFVLALIFYLPNTQTLLDYEDACWIRDDFHLHRHRLTQRVLMHWVLLPLLGHRVEGYYLAAAGLHLLGALLIHACVLRLSRTFFTPLSRDPAAARLAAGLAALLFLAYEAPGLTYLSAVSYQLVTLFGLGMVLCGLAYFRSRRLAWWWGALLLAALAAARHGDALGLPLVMLSLELAWRRNRVVSEGLERTLWRHLTLALIPCCALALKWGALSEDAPGLERLLRPLHDGQMAGVLALHVSHFFATLGADLLDTSRGLLAPVELLFPREYLYWSMTRVFIALGVVACVLLWVVSLARRGALSLPGVLVIFFLVWAGITFHQIFYVGYDPTTTWRHYFAMAGACLVLGMAAGQVLGPLLAIGPPRLGAALLGVVLLLSLLLDGRARRDAAALVRGRARVSSPHGWRPSCPRLGRLDRAKVKARAASDRQLSCADLSGLDLSGLDLTGVNLSGADLTGAAMDGVRLTGANLSGASLSFVDADELLLMDTDLRGANFTGANVKNADISGARLEGSVWEGAFSFGVRWKGERAEQVQERIRRAAWKPRRKEAGPE